MKSKLYIFLIMLLACTMQVKGSVAIQTHEVVVGNGTASALTTGLGGRKLFSSQVLYTANQIGQQGLVTDIAFSVAAVPNVSSTGTLEIYMAEVPTSQTELTTATMLTKDRMTLVYRSEAYKSATALGWENITLNTPFVYRGGNLVVAISNNNACVSVKYHYTNLESNVNVAINKYHDSTTSYADPFSSSNMNRRDLPNTRFKITSYSEDIVVGSAEANKNDIGLCPYWGCSGSQTLYTKEDLGQAGVISRIAYHVATASSTVKSGTLKIYMGETSQTEITATTMLEAGQMTLVYSSDYSTPTSEGWEEFILSTPFVYSGNNNLVVALSVDKKSQWTSGVKYYCSNPGNRSVLQQNDDETGAASSPFINNTTDGFLNVSMPQTRFGFSEKFVTSKYEEEHSPHTYLGFSPYYSYVSSQSLYHSEEVGNAGFISHVSFQLEKTITKSVVDHVKVYMAEVESSKTSLTSAINTNNMRLVYEGDMTQKGGKEKDWVGVGLQIPFYYSGSGNLVVAVSNTNSDTTAVSYLATYNYQRSVGTGSNTDANSSNPNKASIQATFLPNISFSFVVPPHDCTAALQNGICTVCGQEPAVIDGDAVIEDDKAYLRTTQASVTGTLSYKRTFTSAMCKKWEALYVPIQFEYSSDLAELFSVAEIHQCVPLEDTNGDGWKDAKDDKFFVAKMLMPGAVILPNTPYLIYPNQEGEFELLSNDDILYPANDPNNVVFSTTKERFSIEGNYDFRKNMLTDGLMCLADDGTITKATSNATALNPFRWTVMVTKKVNSGIIPERIYIASDYYNLSLVDDEKTPFSVKVASPVKYLSYSRTFTEQQANKWQSFYVPFDIVLNEDILTMAEFATIDGVESKGDEDCIVVTKRQSGYTIPANTPCVIRMHDVGTFDLYFEDVTLMPVDGRPIAYSANHTYTFTGVYEPYHPGIANWYALSKKDGKFHPATVTSTLPAYRFYMTITDEIGQDVNASEIRLGFKEIGEEETCIQGINEDASSSDVYSIDGRRVQFENLQPGIYVKNGRKFRIQ